MQNLFLHEMDLNWKPKSGGRRIFFLNFLDFNTCIKKGSIPEAVAFML